MRHRNIVEMDMYTSDTTPDERQIVLDILVEHARTKKYSNILTRQALDSHPELSATQKAFIKRLTEGTIEREMELDGIIRRHLKNPKASLKLRVRCILRMAVYEIYYMDSVSDYAAVNEAVSLLKKEGLPQLSGFVNAILRSICRDKAAAGTITRNRGSTNIVIGGQMGRGKIPSTANKAEHFSMPEEIVQLWTDDYGPVVTEKLLQSMLAIRPVCIRFDARVSMDEREEILRKMRDAGVVCQQGRWLSYAYTLEHTGNVENLPGFAEGKWTIQDESSMLVCEAAGLGEKPAAELLWQKRPPEVILDLCAAPGGKSLHAACLVPDGCVYAYDLTRERTDLIRQNAARMRCSNLVIEEHDATEYNPVLEECADIVLCDLPCSGLGVMTRKKDIKYHFSLQKIQSLAALQRKILKNAIAYVKPGGILIYSTCTIDRTENDQIAAWIERKPGMEADPLAPFLPDGIPGIHHNQIQLFPYLHHTDGFFIARFHKT